MKQHLFWLVGNVAFAGYLERVEFSFAVPQKASVVVGQEDISWQQLS